MLWRQVKRTVTEVSVQEGPRSENAYGQADLGTFTEEEQAGLYANLRSGRFKSCLLCL